MTDEAATPPDLQDKLDKSIADYNDLVLNLPSEAKATRDFAAYVGLMAGAGEALELDMVAQQAFTAIWELERRLLTIERHLGLTSNPDIPGVP